MIKSVILPLIFILASFSSFGQNEEPVSIRVPLIQNQYHGCCLPVRRVPSRCTPIPDVIEVDEESSTLDITDPELSGFTASPNPSKGFLSVSVSPSLIGYEIQVIDMTGRFVGNPVPITGTIENLTIEGESGVYLISIRTEKEVITERILLDTH